MLGVVLAHSPPPVGSSSPPSSLTPSLFDEDAWDIAGSVQDAEHLDPVRDGSIEYQIDVTDKIERQYTFIGCC